MNCSKPRLIYNKYLCKNVFVACGKCDNCRISKSNQMVPRVINECNSSVANVFFTLTYDNKHIPYLDAFNHVWLHRSDESICLDDKVDVDELNKMFSLSPANIYKFENFVLAPDIKYINNRAVLYKYDVQMFIKRVREYLKYHVEDFVPNYSVKLEFLKYHPSYEEEFKKEIEEFTSIRYVVCGEYGTKNHRPHYHGIFHCRKLQTAEFLLKVIPQCWQYCDWDKVAQIKGRDGRSGLPSLVGSSASAYVSSYINSYDNQFPLSRVGYFKPFLIYSQKPIYGLSEIDKDIEQKIFTGVDYGFERSVRTETGNVINVVCSSLLIRKLWGRLPNSRLYTIEDICTLCQRPCYALTGGEKQFVSKIKHNILSKYGKFVYWTIKDYVTNVWSFLQRFKSFKLSKQLKEFQPSNIIDYVKKQFNTFADFFTQNSESSIKDAKTIDSLSYRLHCFAFAYRDTLPLLSIAKLPQSSLFDVFAVLRHQYWCKYQSRLIPKHSHHLNNKFYATI